MINNIITKSLCLSALAVLIAGCTNLDESAFQIQPTDGEDVIFSETFEDGLGDFILKSNSGNQIWSYYSNGYAIMTGYENSVNYANEDWLISPEINLTEVSNAYLTFDHVGRYFSDIASEATVMIAENYDPKNETSSVEWKQLKTEPFSNADNWTFGTTEQISLDLYVGKKIRIAFKYTSTATKAGTWELKNVVVHSGKAQVNATSIYAESFGSSLGKFNAYSVSGDEKWYVLNGYAYMTGYVNSTNKANLDWLISPEIDLTTQQSANFSFDHVTRYFASLATEATVQVSLNYVNGTRPDSATWTQVATSPFADPGSWTFSNSQKLSLTAYCGKKIHIAFKYISTASKAGSWEIKNFKVYSGEANGTDFLPYKVSEAISSQTGGLGWVQGYIIGYSWPKLTQFYHYFSPDTCTQIANILIADSLNNLYASKCLSVQLPRGSIRNYANLKTNKSKLGKKIKIYGTLSSNCGIAGLINPTKFIDDNGTIVNSSITTLFSETFSSGLGNFTINDVIGSGQTWKFASGYGASISGFANSVNVENEDWLISPVINLTSLSSAAMSFDHTINKGVVANMPAEQTLWVSVYNTLNATWGTYEKVTIPVYPAGNTWTFVNSGEISLDKYAGKQIKIALRYSCTSSSSATWEVKNLMIFY